jgi:hypothetical protein
MHKGHVDTPAIFVYLRRAVDAHAAECTENGSHKYIGQAKTA